MSGTTSSSREPGIGKVRLVLEGVLWSIFSAFPLAVLLITLFRFPVPFVGYLSGIENSELALFAVLFYGVLGGFVLLGALGVLTGKFVHQRSVKSATKLHAVRITSVGLTFLCLLILSILDWLIGPW